MEKEKQPDLELKDLGGFVGSENYYKVLGFNVTDGVKYAMDNGYSWLVTDALAVIMCNRRIRAEPFLVVKLTVDLEKHEALLTIDDGGKGADPVIFHRQRYGYTDAKRREVKLYFSEGVLMLPSEN